MATIKEAVQRQPIQAILAGITLVGVGIGILNFFLLTAISPIEKRVEALEQTQVINAPLVSQFTEVRTKVDIMFGDIKDIKNFLNIR